MRTSSEIILPPRSLRRNRLLLGASLVATVAASALASGLFSSSPHAGPLLLAVEQVPVYGFERSTPAEAYREPKTVVDAPAVSVMSPLDLSSPSSPESAELEEPATQDDTVYFNGRPVRPVRTMRMTVTGYSPDSRSCGESADGVTACGYSVATNGMCFAAADTRLLPFGSLISVPGYDSDRVVPVLDRGGAIKGHRLDMMYPTHEQARQWGVQELDITVWEYADGKPNGFVARFNSASAVKN